MDYVPNKRSLKKRGILIVLTIIMTLSFSLGAIYFINKFEDSRANELATGLISLEFTEGSEVINLTDQVPVLDEIGLKNTPYEFTVKNTSLVPINAKISLEIDNSTTIHLGAVKYAFYVGDELVKQDNVANIEEGVLYTIENMGVKESLNCKIIFWIDYYYEIPLDTFKAKIKVTGESFDIIYEEPPTINETLVQAIENATTDKCNPVIVEDDITYFSGTNDCVNFNYVWYSGKLWRVTALYPDGTMKMITDDVITTISYGPDYNFYTDEENKSYIYQWLNEDFLDTLYNYENIIVTDAKWNATTGNETINYKLPETTMIEASVGLLNSYEYYMSYKNTNTDSGYLNVSYEWWLLNRYSTSVSNVWLVVNSGVSGRSSPSDTCGGRPSIYLKSSIQLEEGTGTESDPYRIKGDKEEAVANTTLLNTRISGEYVNVNDELFRIVGTEVVGEKTTTKLNKVDYIRDTSDAVKTKAFASKVTYGSSASTGSDDYWDYYLNNTWLKEFDSTYNSETKTSSILVKGNYYLGKATTSTGYKTSICATASNIVTTKECEKTTSIWSGYVGLARYGEMFASQLGSGSDTSSNMWLITPSGTSSVWYVSYFGSNGSDSLSTAYGGRPSINLKSEIIITGGSGLKGDPYEVALPTT